MVDIHRPELKRQRQRKQWLYGGIAAAILAVAGIALASLNPAAPLVQRSAVWTDTVRSGEFVREVRGPGTLVPKEIRWIAADSAGRVERILVKPGARVEVDTVLVELTNPELVQQAEESSWAAEAAAAEWRSLEAELDRQLLDARGDLAAVRADHEGAQLQAEAEGGLSEQGVVSKLQFRQTELRAEQLGIRLALEEERIVMLQSSMKAQLAAQQAMVEQANRLKAQREQQVANLSIRAGIAGVLQQVPVEEGQQVELGASVARVARPDELIAELRIAETQARDVQLDQVVRVDTRNGIVPGRVIRIDPAVQGGSVQVDVELTAALPQGARPDLSVDGTIEIERLSDVVFVGRPAYGQPESTLHLFKVENDGEARRVEVALGRASVNLIEIRSGLQPGDLVVLSDTSAWNQHDTIRLE
jgi:HlyD family secretion protein